MSRAYTGGAAAARRGSLYERANPYYHRSSDAAEWARGFYETRRAMREAAIAAAAPHGRAPRFYTLDDVFGIPAFCDPDCAACAAAGVREAA